MDTDYISKEAYNVIRCAARFDDTLKALIGAECSESTDEDEYLEHILDLIAEIKEGTKEYLEEWGLEDQFSVHDYREKLKTVEAEVKRVQGVPKASRTYEEW